jgi:hypothetical protein
MTRGGKNDALRGQSMQGGEGGARGGNDVGRGGGGGGGAMKGGVRSYTTRCYSMCVLFPVL